ncbi:hypothetical protein ATI61_114154 [Archangium gephyra]|uniref:HEAT repeat domain-containing protein n=1 Tax=Archangium gephyra TaxID=48 RepID=A0AAC8Q545_9BACT|nr:hypothetical protein [Archangium gephyra]AKJ01136.1 Hypothetical protein AA314_02762 [Archangium gephyra]REG24546.1 hypothetical protein ATI61_114154 [Archangium gephyra]
MHSHSHRGFTTGRAWRALLLALGLSLPAGAAGPESPKPDAAELFRRYVSDKDEPTRQALSALGPDAAITILGTPDPNVTASRRDQLLSELDPPEERLVRLFRALGSKNKAAADLAATLLTCNDGNALYLERAAKTPATVEEARRLLGHPTPVVRQLAAALLTAAGQRGGDIQRELKGGLLQCREYLQPLFGQNAQEEDVTKELVLATLDSSGDEQKVVEPRLVYRKGRWEPLAGPLTAPSQWFVLTPKARTLQTEKTSVLVPSGCDTRFWALRATGEAESVFEGLAASRKLEFQRLQQGPDKLQAAVKDALKLQSAAELKLLKEQLRNQAASAEEPSTAWTRARRPSDERAQCSPVTGTEWICYARQERELRATNGAEPLSHLCRSLFWLRGNESAMRIIQSSRECLVISEEMEREDNVRKPLGAMMLEGHPYWVLSTSFGPGGFELWEARADGMHLVAPIRYQWGACD